jgi:hypothetical protein
MLEGFRKPLELTSSTNVDHDWRVDVPRDDIMARYREVLAASPEEAEGTRKVTEVMERAYERWRLGQQDR